MRLVKRSLALALILLLLVLPAASRPQTAEDIRRSVAVKKFEDTSIFQTKPTETGWDFSRSKDKTGWDYNYKTEFHLSTTSGPSSSRKPQGFWTSTTRASWPARTKSRRRLWWP